MIRLWLFRGEDDDEFMVLDTEGMDVDQLEKEYHARPYKVLAVAGNPEGWPTNCVMIAESD